MNLTQIIAETGKRVRLGKTRDDQLTNAQIKQVLDTAVEIMKEGLIDEGRIEVQDFAVFEVIRSQVENPNTLTTFDGDAVKMPAERVRWVFKPSKAFRLRVKRART